MDKWISIIIPCYNVEALIDRCLDSLVKQTIGIEHLELICIDDASTDKTWDRMTEWEKKYPESIMLIKNSINMRQGGARNVGLQYASAPYIGFVDSDDWVDATMYKKMYDKIEEYQCDVVNCLSKRIFNEGERLERKGEDEYYQISSIEDRKRLLNGNVLHGGIWAKIYKRELIYNHDIQFPEGLAYEDNYWGFLLCFYIKDVYMIREELYHYYVNLESTICKKNDIRTLDRLKIELMKLDECYKRGLYYTYKEEIEALFIEAYLLNTCHLIFCNWDNFPIHLFLKMMHNAKQRFPNYKENKYLIKSKDMIDILEFVEHTATQEKLDWLQGVYRKQLGL